MDHLRKDKIEVYYRQITLFDVDLPSAITQHIYQPPSQMKIHYPGTHNHIPHIRPEGQTNQYPIC